MDNNSNNKVIIDALDNINNKLLEHDKQFSGINNTLTKLIEVDMSIKDLKNSTNKVFNRLEVLEKQANGGECPALRTREHIRAEQIKNYEEKNKNYDIRLCQIENTVKEMKNLPNELLKKILLTIVSTIAGGVVLIFIFHKHF